MKKLLIGTVFSLGLAHGAVAHTTWYEVGAASTNVNDCVISKQTPLDYMAQHPGESLDVNPNDSGIVYINNGNASDKDFLNSLAKCRADIAMHIQVNAQTDNAGTDAVPAPVNHTSFNDDQSQANAQYQAGDQLNLVNVYACTNSRLLYGMIESVQAGQPAIVGWIGGTNKGMCYRITRPVTILYGHTAFKNDTNDFIYQFKLDDMTVGQRPLNRTVNGSPIDSVPWDGTLWFYGTVPGL
jgi:hypothetical protein